MLDVTAIIPIRSIKHTLTELDKTRTIISEDTFKDDEKRY